MPSSSRIIRPASSTATAERGRASDPEGTFDSIDGGDPARDAPVLRGNPNARRAGVNALPADSDSGADRGGPAPTDHPPIDLLQAQRIADQRGYAVGHARSTTELGAAIASVGALAERLEAVAPTRTTAVARAIADIAVALARRIIGAQLRHDPALLVHSIETAVTMINGSPEARVLLHPSAVEPVRAAWEAAHGSTHLGKRWTFEADDSFAPGACLLRFDHGFVDAGIEAQLAEIERAIDAAIPGLWSGVPTNGDTLAAETAR
jgi:Flagellar assembly protein FliH